MTPANSGTTAENCRSRLCFGAILQQVAAKLPWFRNSVGINDVEDPASSTTSRYFASWTTGSEARIWEWTRRARPCEFLRDANDVCDEVCPLLSAGLKRARLSIGELEVQLLFVSHSKNSCNSISTSTSTVTEASCSGPAAFNRLP